MIVNPSSPRRPYPALVATLYLLFAVYLALPLVDVPLLGLSLSAPLFFIIALYALLHPPEPWLRRYALWLALAALIWAGIFLSTMLNGLLSGGVEIESGGVINLIRYAYWLLTLVLTVYLVSRAGLGLALSKLFAWAVVLLALLRWGEALCFERIGAWSGAALMPQNGYGLQFSTLAPFLYPFAFQPGRWRPAALAGIALVWGAAAINGSRASWAALAAGFALCALVQLLAGPHRRALLGGLLVLLILGTAAVSLAPHNYLDAVTQRSVTLGRLEEDKSFAIRGLMLQKGWRLFLASPLYGIGIGRFKLESTELDIPDVLAYAGQYHFDVKSSHNSYIQFLAETGLLGSIPLLLLLIVLSWCGGWAALRACRRGEAWSLGTYAAWAGMSVHLWALSGITGTLPWVVYGLVGALIVRQRVLAEAGST